MAAEIINDEPQEQSGADEFAAEASKDQTQQTIENDVPEEYRGKSTAELVKILQDQKSFIGRQSVEVGEVRRLADQLIQRQFAQQASQAPKQEQPQVDDADFLLSPKEAVEKLVANHPALRQVQMHAAQAAAEARKKALEERHPDLKEIVKDPEFHAWLQQSPARTQKFVQAHRMYDAAAGDELLTSFKELREARKVAAEGASKLREEAGNTLRAHSAPSGAPSTSGGKKTFRRADLIQLQLTDPNRYMALQDEIMAAYAEGRVK